MGLTVGVHTPEPKQFHRCPPVGYQNSLWQEMGAECPVQAPTSAPSPCRQQIQWCPEQILMTQPGFRVPLCFVQLQDKSGFP